MASSSSSSNQKPRVSHHATCLCSPTNHPGSFRCARHRLVRRTNNNPPPPASSYWGLIAVAKTNSLKAFLLQIIRPSCHNLQPRKSFKPRPSRFSLMNRDAATDSVAVS